VSLAVKRNTYVPDVENVAVVVSALGLPNVTVLGPLTFDHVVCRVPLGNPSSDAVPERFAVAGRVIVCAVPAFTTGALFVPELTAVIVTSDVDDSAVSLPVSRNT